MSKKKRTWTSYQDKFNHYYDQCSSKSQEKGQLFLGFVGDGRVRLKSKCKLFCKLKGLYWESTSVEKHLRRDGCSCKMCSRERSLDSVRLDETEMIKSLDVACRERDSLFIGWKDKKFNGIYSLVEQYCGKHDFTWDTTHAKSLLDGAMQTSGCKHCHKELMLMINNKKDIHHIQQFLDTQNFLDGTRFWRNNDKLTKCGARNYFNYTCPVCSNDEYVKAGLCSGVFTSFIGHLKAGRKSCRCSIGFRWTQEQKTFRVGKLIEESNIHVSGWVDKDTLELTCSNCHTDWCPSYNNVVFNGNRCPVCSTPQCELGFYPERFDWEDHLYLLEFKNGDEKFCKVGRAFSMKSRLREYPKHYAIDVLSSVVDTHTEVYATEQTLIKILRKEGHHYRPTLGFGGSARECFTLDILNHPEIISTFNLKPLDN